jgi:hypothetical protein
MVRGIQEMGKSNECWPGYLTEEHSWLREHLGNWPNRCKNTNNIPIN